MNQFSEMLKQHRLARQLTLDELARALGVSKPTIWAWENAKSRPRAERHAALAQILQLPLDSLMNADSSPIDQSRVVRECKERIAEAFELDPSAVRIRIEL
jgi:transcriptional regulator with XRE-family HTH domain